MTTAKKLESGLDFLILVVLPIGLAFIMFTLGVGLTLDDFARVVQRPLAFLVGAFNQIILLPVVTFLCILAFDIKAEFAVGFMILAACPGGVTSNILSKFAKADIALSVSLTAVISLLCVVTVPLILSVSLARFVGANAPGIDITSTAIKMFAITIVPICLGIAFRYLAPVIMKKAESILERLAIALLTAIVLAALIKNWELFIENVPELGPAMLTLSVLFTVIGYALARLLGRNRREAKTISIETGVQNAAVGITVATLIATNVDGANAYALPAAVYGIVMYLVILPVIFMYRRLA